MKGVLVLLIYFFVMAVPPALANTFYLTSEIPKVSRRIAAAVRLSNALNEAKPKIVKALRSCQAIATAIAGKSNAVIQ